MHMPPLLFIHPIGALVAMQQAITREVFVLQFHSRMIVESVV